MSSLKWLGVWGMVNSSLPTAADENSWSKGMQRVLQDPKGCHYFEKFTTERNIPRPQGECTHFQHLTIRQIICIFK